MSTYTDYPEKARSMADLRERLALAPERLAAAIAGLDDRQFAASPYPGKWSIAATVEHVALVSLGWTDIFYQAIEGSYLTPRDVDPAWRSPFEAEAELSVSAALAVYRRHNAAVARFLGQLPPSDFDRPFKVVSFLTEPFQIKESINWGLVLHCDYHLATIFYLRRELGVPLPWLSVYPARWPKPMLDVPPPPLNWRNLAAITLLKGQLHGYPLHQRPEFAVCRPLS